MSELLIHKKTTDDVKRFIDEPSQFLIITGPIGAGKTALALKIGSQLMDRQITAEHPAVLHLSLPPNKSEISIDQVRQIISKLKLATPGEGHTRRILIIEDGHRLSEEAQNALLKTLEEPPADTQIFMTVDSPSSILPTITSRGRILEVKPVELAAAKKHFGGRSSESEVEKAWLMADGLAGLTGSLLNHSDMHELKLAVSDAKEFIAASKYRRLIRVSEFAKTRHQLEMLIEGLRKVIKTAQRQAILDGKQLSQTRMIFVRKQLDELSDALRANVSPKTVYLKLCLNLGL